MSENNSICYKYFFIFNDGQKQSFEINLNKRTLKYIPSKKLQPAAWTKLEHSQCTNCPLSKDEYPDCPLALNLADVVPKFSSLHSYDDVHVMIETKERTYSQNTSLQRALSAMLGIFMVTSDCPIMASLKPMVRFHLPFASVEETVFRSVSTYLLSQYFKFKNGEHADWNLDSLMDNYKDIQLLNQGMATRMRSVVNKDANLNALVVLDVFAKELPFSIQKSLESLEYLFEDEKPQKLL
jgi:Domain of unknown function (DUF6901)